MATKENLNFDSVPLNKDAINEAQPPNDKIEPFNWAVFLACVSVSTTNLHTGFALGYSAIVSEQLERSHEMGILEKSTLSLITSSVSIAAPLGCLFIAYSLDKFGRIGTFKMSLWPCFLGWLSIGIAQNTSMIILGRLLTGFAMSVGTNSANVYMAEISTPKLRGSMMSIGSVMLSFGILLMYTAGMFFHWRVVAWIAFVGAVMPVFMTAFWTPESPLWLIFNEKESKAMRSLQYFTSKSNSECVGNAKLEDIKKLKEKKVFLLSQQVNGNWFKRAIWHLSKPTGYKPVILMTIFFLLQQFTGIYTLQFYAVNMLSNIAKEIDIKLATIIFGTVRLILSFMATGVLHKYGRRPLCMNSAIVMGLSLFVSGLCLYLRKSGVENVVIVWLPFICMLLYISAGSMGLMLIPWMMPSEMFPTEVKGLFIGPIMGWCNAVMFAAVYSYKYLLDALGMSNVLWLYSSVSLLTAVFVWVFVPETHGKKLCEIEEYFKDNTIYLLKNKKTIIVSKSPAV
ncbi:facilitated trehalose transporter Tret1-like [Adelges cooleyi]|uniref:facilitated trehalose transporter Tret1-like n=1 Tax=Adelges cooleyi TaxID=133065 RepID=UPI00217FDC6E|nr:facilitated trehalose transporter Tret1-like [Adelges cooleyi]XP_050420600.1 facilitated trehalose transporter Tret1-like [Adelges cooleyi]XP_050420601.1 facilitated trehalose transporter Tret1-like [Adelges cooleyi]XP_050420602.1 facilitated trehalose transporter Tret1-like [Adelges cooleyi]XP_050420604.1 facilitated trehalose transporter Tret1-like [Adelges cooleyi]